MDSKTKSIYFYVYPSAFQNAGGGEVLLRKTQEYLGKMGVFVKPFDLWKDRFKEGDLLHVFGSVKEALGLMETAKSKGVRIVISPIIWYNWQSSFSIPYHFTERMRCILRQAIKTFFPFTPSSRKKMVQLSDLVLAGSKMEADQIRRYFLIPERRIRVVPYGADECFNGTDGDIFYKKYGLKDFILTVGRIEPRKNQLNLIRAMRESERPLVIIGSPVSRHQDYYERCLHEAGKNTRFLGPLAPDSAELRSAYAACSVFVLPTWFETPGLSALEAGLSGARLVVTREGSTHEYFKDYADYVNPASVSDIRNKILTALKREKTKQLRDHLKQNYLWTNCARQTLDCYRLVGL